jgi:hypothetical protein
MQKLRPKRPAIEQMTKTSLNPDALLDGTRSETRRGLTPCGCAGRHAAERAFAEFEHAMSQCTERRNFAP